ncbi:hypothetical protein [Streptomyces gilvus]|uniref:hypothetical protein n=1 Tax=Streptomyces gilvus TaxID=2920937 RepID=UPI001F0F228C|nr:hypothetical protein [Streptomyces sp. CME 23]MCH5672947.1 hypothetical protein [Streptomyces sp. CME 23]
MEQRIGSSSQPLKAEPVKGAGFDPAFIPGLTSPVAEEPEDATSEGGDVEAEEAEQAQTPVVGADETDAGSGAEDAEDGPVFEASDRRARIVADRRGIRLSLDEEKCEFRWDEIGAVETETPRFGKRYTVTVHTPDRRWYPIEIEATSRARFQEWDEQLDAVLDAYFDDEADDTADANPDDKADAKPDDKAETPDEDAD